MGTAGDYGSLDALTRVALNPLGEERAALLGNAQGGCVSHGGGDDP